MVRVTLGLMRCQDARRCTRHPTAMEMSVHG
jgi:hypothetical protein